MWPKEYIELKHIEDLLVCGICYEIMETSVITLCSHNYCSLCIRKYLHYKTQCPACFSETFEKDLRKNKVLDEIIGKFSQIKNKLKRCLQIQVQFMQDEKGDITVDLPVNTQINNLVDQNKGIDINKQEVTNSSAISNNGSPSVRKNVQELQKDFSSPSTSGKSRIPLMFTPKSIKCTNVVNTEDTKVVICPVCKVTISELNINRHLDDCLKREATKDQPQKVESKRKPLPKLVFSLMKEAVMKKKLKEFGLSTQGDRKAMETRLQRYIVLYNAECDKLNPRAISELIKQCEDEENVEKKINKSSLFINRLQVNRNTEENIVDTERKKYLETHKGSFESLIKKIKGMEDEKKSSVRRSLLNESTDSNETIPRKLQLVDNENSDDSINSTDKNDFNPINRNVYIQDSDSDTSCPLQIYSSTDPTKFLNVELISDKSIEQSETEMNSGESSSKGELNYSRIKTKKNMYSDTLSDVSLSNKNIPKFDTKGTSNIRHKMSQKKKKLYLNDEMRRMDCATACVEDSDSNNGSEVDAEKEPIPVLQDILCDISSNDSIESKFNHGKGRSIDHGFLNNSILNSSNLEKENISSSPECSINRSFRKRSREAAQNDIKVISNTMKKVRTNAPKCVLSETEESNEESVSVLNENEEKQLQKRSRLRKRVSSTKVIEGTPSLRKSTRMRVKTHV